MVMEGKGEWNSEEGVEEEESTRQVRRGGDTRKRTFFRDERKKTEHLTTHPASPNEEQRNSFFIKRKPTICNFNANDAKILRGKQANMDHTQCLMAYFIEVTIS